LWACIQPINLNARCAKDNAFTSYLSVNQFTPTIA
jgi:hypothetical protein